MKLAGLGFAFYRSIGEEPVFVDLQKKVNILIGANNSGKSNILRALHWIRSRTEDFRATSRENRLDELDRHRRSDHPFRLIVDVNAEEDDGPLARVSSGENLRFEFETRQSNFVCTKTPFGDMDWQEFSDILKQVLDRYFSACPSKQEFTKECADVASVVVHRLLRSDLPNVHIVPQFRQITGGGEYTLGGQGIVAKLGSWQNPTIGNDEDIRHFRKIEQLLRDLLNMPSAELEVDHKGEKIIVFRNELRLPLENYGTGIHELIILAIALYSQDNAIFCIEEPEIHLHPGLQKQFLRFLREETGNRYVLTTHSNALLSPSEDVLITHLWLDDEGVTRGQPVVATEQALQVLSDLGVQASDVLQANSVIWVEGPSDRIYIKRWLELFAPDLQEGIHFSIMFYGGRLLSHLSLERDGDSAADELIDLLRINQHSIVVIDSDKTKRGERINATKLRVSKECEKNGLVCWITHGREIENYLPVDCISSAYEEITGMPPGRLTFDRFDRLEARLKKAYGKGWKSAFSYDKSKPKRARKIIEHFQAAHISLELKKELNSVVKAIERAS